MYYLRILSFAFVLLPVAFATEDATAANSGPLCSVNLNCSNEEAFVWASDHNKCFLFRNECHLANFNCPRQTRYAECNALYIKQKKEHKRWPIFCHYDILSIVTKETCQRLCSDICSITYDPVCGEYRGKFSTFSNQCSMNGYNCKTEKAYVLQPMALCETDSN